MKDMKMDMDGAIAMVDTNCTRIPMQHMARALAMHSWNNTPADWARLAAARYVLRHWQAYQAECNRRRDRRGR
jgi:hypothetical protein